MRHRKIEGLAWVNDEMNPDGHPEFGTTSKARYIKAGHVFEERVGEYLQARFGEDRVLVQPWIEYEDENGHGWARPDVILSRPSPNGLIIFECKLSYTPRKAKAQYTDLYKPLFKFLYPGETITGVQVCRVLNKQAKGDKNVLPSLDGIFSGKVQSGFHSVKFTPPTTTRRRSK